MEKLVSRTSPLVSLESRAGYDGSFAQYAEVFSRGQQSSIFRISLLGKEDWSKLTTSRIRRVGCAVFTLSGLEPDYPDGPLRGWGVAWNLFEVNFHNLCPAPIRRASRESLIPTEGPK